MLFVKDKSILPACFYEQNELLDPFADAVEREKGGEYEAIYDYRRKGIYLS